MFRKIKRLIYKTFRPLRFINKRKKFKNNSLSVFASDCVGCTMLHDLGLRFNSPFVNLYLNAKDFIKYLKDPCKYNSLEFTEVRTDKNYPVGLLGDIEFNFVHYKTFEEAVQSFKRRVKRINFESLYIIMSEKNGCTYDDMIEFDRLPYKNKVIFTHLKYNDIKSSFYISGFENQGCIGNIMAWDKKIGSRIYDRFDFANWLNEESVDFG